MEIEKREPLLLTRLLQDLRRMTMLLTEVPTLVIDDAADEAPFHVNVPKGGTRRGRGPGTALNHLVSNLLDLLPQAQYVGYTPTPFARALIDPSAAANLFPRHFIVSLPWPDGYMGIEDPYDFDSEVAVEQRTFANSQQTAHVRAAGGNDGLRQSLSCTEFRSGDLV
ncbi:hypothetical protein [Streptomyces sp. NPDC001401]|uniref:hypothetical protein n=1 Tax=Streptomyces sp. NPDC001401 TaxID=3364570 RepID=UPI003685C755